MSSYIEIKEPPASRMRIAKVNPSKQINSPRQHAQSDTPSLVTPRSHGRVDMSLLCRPEGWPELGACNLAGQRTLDNVIKWAAGTERDRLR